MRLSTLVTEINTRALIGSHCPICLPGLVAVETRPSWTSGRSASGARLDGFGPSLALQRRPAQGNKSHLLLAWVYCPPTLHKGERTSRAGEGHRWAQFRKQAGERGPSHIPPPEGSAENRCFHRLRERFNCFNTSQPPDVGRKHWHDRAH